MQEKYLDINLEVGAIGFIEVEKKFVLLNDIKKGDIDNAT